LNLAGAADRGRAIDNQRRRIAVDDDCAIVNQSAGRESSARDLERRAWVDRQKADACRAAEVVVRRARLNDDWIAWRIWRGT